VAVEGAGTETVVVAVVASGVVAGFPRAGDRLVGRIVAKAVTSAAGHLRARVREVRPRSVRDLLRSPSPGALARRIEACSRSDAFVVVFMKPS